MGDRRVAAVIDSTITVNQAFHNTLWVPAHFHTYYLMGVVLMTLGGVYHLAVALTSETENLKRSRVMAAHLVVGGYGLMLSFYLAGADAVPRRFAAYPIEVATGPSRRHLARLHPHPVRRAGAVPMGHRDACAPARCAHDACGGGRLRRGAPAAAGVSSAGGGAVAV